jgi:hypothetical protein
MKHLKTEEWAEEKQTGQHHDVSKGVWRLMMKEGERREPGTYP